MSEDEPVIGGIVLAAGGGSRFGATKQLAQLRGRPLLSYAVEAMLSVPAIWPVVVVLGHDAEAIRDGVDLRGRARSSVCERLARAARRPRCGPASRRSAPSTPRVITLGDQPFITPQVIAGALDYDDRLPRRRAHDLRRRAGPSGPAHAARCSTAPASCDGDVGFRDLLEGQRVRRFEAGRLCDPTDIDTQEELARL